MKRKRLVIGTYDFELFEQLRNQLAGPGLEILFVQRGVKILIEILDHDVDLLILDLDLTGILGIEILPVIRRLRPRLPIILITEDVNTRIRKIAAELGVHYQAYKPISGIETDAITHAATHLLQRNSQEKAVFA